MKKKGLAVNVLLLFILAIVLIFVIGLFLSRTLGEARNEGFSIGYGKIPEKNPIAIGGSSEPSGPPTILAIVTVIVICLKTILLFTKQEWGIYALYPFDDSFLDGIGLVNVQRRH